MPAKPRRLLAIPDAIVRATSDIGRRQHRRDRVVRRGDFGSARVIADGAHPQQTREWWVTLVPAGNEQHPAGGRNDAVALRCRVPVPAVPDRLETSSAAAALRARGSPSSSDRGVSLSPRAAVVRELAEPVGEVVLPLPAPTPGWAYPHLFEESLEIITSQALTGLVIGGG